MRRKDAGWKARAWAPEGAGAREPEPGERAAVGAGLRGGAVGVRERAAFRGVAPAQYLAERQRQLALWEERRGGGGGGGRRGGGGGHRGAGPGGSPGSGRSAGGRPRGRPGAPSGRCSVPVPCP